MIKKWAKDLNRHLTKDDIQMANKHEMFQIICHQENAVKRTMRYNCTPIGTAKILSTYHTKC